MRGLAAYKRLCAEYDRLSKRVAKARVSLAKCCTHPASELVDYEWVHDNGYGRQTRHIGKMCLICRRADPWNRGEFSSRSAFE